MVTNKNLSEESCDLQVAIHKAIEEIIFTRVKKDNTIDISEYFNDEYIGLKPDDSKNEYFLDIYFSKESNKTIAERFIFKSYRESFLVTSNNKLQTFLRAVRSITRLLPCYSIFQKEKQLLDYKFYTNKQHLSKLSEKSKQKKLFYNLSSGLIKLTIQYYLKDDLFNHLDNSKSPTKRARILSENIGKGHFLSFDIDENYVVNKQQSSNRFLETNTTITSNKIRTYSSFEGKTQCFLDFSNESNSSVESFELEVEDCDPALQLFLNSFENYKKLGSLNCINIDIEKFNKAIMK